MALEDHTKKDLAAMIRELQAKLIEMKPVESQLKADAQELKANAIGLHKDEKGNFSLVKIKFDLDKKAAAISEIESLGSSDDAIASYKLNQYASEMIMRKTRGGKYD